MHTSDKPAKDSKALWEQVHRQIPQHQILLGTATAAAYLSDPKMLAFVASRYKFAAKLLQSRDTVIEIGCGDGFGAPLMAQSVGHLVCTDIHEGTLADNRARLTPFR